jgi:hypothetical protein
MSTMWMAGMDRPERRRARVNPRAKLLPGTTGRYPALQPRAWYTMHITADADPAFVWLQTAHGLTRVHRVDVELQGETP